MSVTAAERAQGVRAGAAPASPLAGTRELVRLGLRRDRVMLPVWVFAVVALAVGTASSFMDLYPTVESRRPFAEGVATNAGLLLITGPTFDLSSIGGLTAWRIGGLGAVLTAIMSYLLVVRHTRAEEEEGRLELVGAGVVGRRAPLAAALLIALEANAIVAAFVAAGLTSLGLPVAGSVALGLALGTAGCVFASVAGVTAQLTETARAANGLAGAVLGAAFLLRGVGDSSGPVALSWLSPLGWMQRVRPFAGERWWVFGLAAVLVAVLVGACMVATERRDLGAGVLGVRPGPAVGSIRGSWGLAWRLHRAALLGWAAGMLVAGAVLGSVAQGMQSLLDGSPQLGRMFEQLGGAGSLVDSYLAFAFGSAAVIVGAFAVQATLRMRTEETSGHAEQLLATATGRVRWALGHLAVAVLGSVALLAVCGLGAGVAHGLDTRDAGQVPRLAAAAVVQAPGAWVFAGVAVLLTGLLPRLTAAAWAALVFATFLTWFGSLLGLPTWLRDLSPFTHLPALPADPFTLPPLLWLTALTAALTTAALAALTRRDLP